MQQHQFQIAAALRAFTLATTCTGLLTVVGCDSSAIQRPYTPPGPPGTITSSSMSAAGQSGDKAGQGSSKPSDAGAKKPTPASVSEDDGDGGVIDASVDEELHGDGDACRLNDECASGYCNNDICCSDGSCCAVDADCPGAGKVGNVCDYHATCQGSRGIVKCSNFRCVAENSAPNDTRCDEDVEANDCGPYQSVYCDGTSDQRAPQCADSCAKDAECDRNAHCIDGACVAMAATPRCTTNAMCARSETCTGGRCVAPAGTSTGAASSCMQQVGTDRCAECACSKCGTTATACYNSGNAQRDQQCTAVLNCALPAACIDAADCTASSTATGGGLVAANPYGCFGRSCYCGTSADCYNSPTGMCARQIEAGGGTSNITDLQARRSNRQYATYYAEQHAQCLERSCRTECGL